MKKVNIGLDVGIASVGWSILDADSFEIINHGVRLFSEPTDNKSGKPLNQERRAKRQLRRQLRRKWSLKYDFILFLANKKIINLEIIREKKKILILLLKIILKTSLTIL